MTGTQHTRRDFLKTSALGSAIWVAGRGNRLAAESANEKLNIGAIGVGGRAAGDLQRVSTENIVAICDVDEVRLGKAAGLHPHAKKYHDYRQLLEQDNLDAVVIGTPDHHHAPAAIRALRRGLHVYCEKPLTHTVREARLLTETARKMNVATQMGTQNHEHPGYLKLIELVQSGAIGAVHEAHVITDRPGSFWSQGLTVPTEKPAIPPTLHWNEWLGPAAERAYHPAYVPFKWRGWWDFGCGAIGDMAIHLMDPVFVALNLGGPVKVTSTGPAVLPDSGPTEMVSKLEFGARGDLAPCTVYWYEGEAKPAPEIAKLLPMNGSLLIGETGKISCQHAKYPTLITDDETKSFQPEKETPFNDVHHHQQWITACKTGSPTGSNFDYAGPFTEIVLLGNVAYRTGETIHYDPASMKVTNIPRANDLLDKEYRTGWEV